MNLSFHSDWVEWCVDHRTPVLTAIFQFFTALGDMPGFILIIVLVYVAYDKRLAIRLAVLALVTMSFNHVLKTVIHNPRPFMSDGSYRTKWAVSAARAADLATEYSTPSGHAMGSASFYTYAALLARKRSVQLGFATCALLIGASRPYLGVHYVEDVLGGWLLGIGVALLAIRYGGATEQRWRPIPYGARAVILAVSSVGLWLATWALSDWHTSEPPAAFISYAGLLTGIMLSYPLEDRWVNFDPRPGSIGSKLARYLICLGTVVGTLVILDVAFAFIAAKSSPLGQLLRYVRYTGAAMMGLFGAPVLFARLGFAVRRRLPEHRSAR
jgi:membrane-associated phospholipid phosphatase